MESKLSSKSFPKHIPTSHDQHFAAHCRRTHETPTKTCVGDYIAQRPSIPQSQNSSQTMSYWSTQVQNHPNNGPIPGIYGEKKKITNDSMFQYCVTNMKCSKLMHSTGSIATNRQNSLLPPRNPNMYQKPDQSTMVSNNRLGACSQNPKDTFNYGTERKASVCTSDSGFNKSMRSSFLRGNSMRNGTFPNQYSNTNSISGQTMQNIDYVNFKTSTENNSNTKSNFEIPNDSDQRSKPPSDRSSELLYFGDVSFFESEKESHISTVNFENSSDISKHHCPISRGHTQDLNFSVKRECQNTNKSFNVPNRENILQITPRGPTKNTGYESLRKNTTEQLNGDFVQHVPQQGRSVPCTQPVTEAKTRNDFPPANHIPCEHGSVGMTDAKTARKLSDSPYTFTEYETKLFQNQGKETKCGVPQNSDCALDGAVQSDGLSHCSQLHEFQTSPATEKSNEFAIVTRYRNLSTPKEYLAFKTEKCNGNASSDKQQYANGTKRIPMVQKPESQIPVLLQNSATIQTPVPTQKPKLAQNPGNVNASVVQLPMGNFSSLTKKQSEMQEVTIERSLRIPKTVGIIATCLEHFLTPGQSISTTHKNEAPYNLFSNAKTETFSTQNKNGLIKGNADTCLDIERASNQLSVIEEQTENHPTSPIRKPSDYLKPVGTHFLGKLNEIIPNANLGRIRHQHRSKQLLHKESLVECKLNCQTELQTDSTDFSDQRNENKVSSHNSSNMNYSPLLDNSLKEASIQCLSCSQNENCNTKLSIENISEEKCEELLQPVESNGNPLAEGGKGRRGRARSEDQLKKKENSNLLRTKIQDRVKRCKSDHSETSLTNSFRCDRCRKHVNACKHIEKNINPEKGKSVTNEHSDFEQMNLLTESANSYSVETHYLEIQIPLPRVTNTNKFVKSKSPSTTQVVGNGEVKSEEITFSKKSSFHLKTCSACHQEVTPDSYTANECSYENDMQCISGDVPVIIYHKYVPGTLNKLSGEIGMANSRHAFQEVKRGLTVSFKESNTSDKNRKSIQEKVPLKIKTSSQNLISNTFAACEVKKSEEINCQLFNSVPCDDGGGPRDPPEILVLHQATKSSFYSLDDNSDSGSNDLMTNNMSDINIFNLNENTKKDEFGIHKVNESQSNSEVTKKISEDSNPVDKISGETVNLNKLERCKSQKYKNIMDTTDNENSNCENSDSDKGTVVANENLITSENDEATYSNSRTSSERHIDDLSQYTAENAEANNIGVDCLFRYLSDQPAIVDNVVSRVAEDLMKKLNKTKELIWSHSKRHLSPNQYRSLSVIESLPTTVQMLTKVSLPTAISQNSTSRVCIVPTEHKKKDSCSSFFQIAHEVGANRYLLMDNIVPNRLPARDAAVNSENASGAPENVPTPPSPHEYIVMTCTTHCGRERSVDGSPRPDAGSWNGGGWDAGERTDSRQIAPGACASQEAASQTQCNYLTVPASVFAHHPESTIGSLPEECCPDEAPPPMHVFDVMLMNQPSHLGRVGRKGCGMLNCPGVTCGPPCSSRHSRPPSRSSFSAGPARQSSGLPGVHYGPVESTRYPAADYRLHHRPNKRSYARPVTPRKRVIQEYIDRTGVKRERVMCMKPEPCGQPMKTRRTMPLMFRPRPPSKVGEMPYYPMITSFKRRYCRNCCLEICPGEELLLRPPLRSGVEILEEELGSTLLDREIEARRPRCLLDNYMYR